MSVRDALGRFNVELDLFFDTGQFLKVFSLFLFGNKFGGLKFSMFDSTLSGRKFLT